MYKFNEQEMFCDIDDGLAIVINSNTGIYYGFNQLSTSVLEQLMAGNSRDKILEALNKLDGIPENIDKKLDHFIHQLVNKQLLISSEKTKAKDITFDPEAAQLSKFDLAVTDYDDAQELLIIDPIHNVNAETGWKPILN